MKMCCVCDRTDARRLELELPPPPLPDIEKRRDLLLTFSEVLTWSCFAGGE